MNQDYDKAAIAKLTPAWSWAFASILANCDGEDREALRERTPCQIRAITDGPDTRIDIKEGFQMGPATATGVNARAAFYTAKEGGPWIFTINVTPSHLAGNEHIVISV